MPHGPFRESLDANMVRDPEQRMWTGAHPHVKGSVTAADRRLLVNRGAPRPMKMGTTVSPWRYDAAAWCAIQSAMLRAPAILYYAFASGA
jgi:hypothetical protein